MLHKEEIGTRCRIVDHRWYGIWCTINSPAARTLPGKEGANQYTLQKPLYGNEALANEVFSKTW